MLNRRFAKTLRLPKPSVRFVTSCGYSGYRILHTHISGPKNRPSWQCSIDLVVSSRPHPSPRARIPSCSPPSLRHPQPSHTISLVHPRFPLRINTAWLKSINCSRLVFPTAPSSRSAFASTCKWTWFRGSFVFIYPIPLPIAILLSAASGNIPVFRMFPSCQVSIWACSKLLCGQTMVGLLALVLSAGQLVPASYNGCAMSLMFTYCFNI